MADLVADRPGPLRPPPHVPALDGLRGVAILAVVAVHLFFGQLTGVRGVDLAYRLAAAGWVGVDLFFVLSGYLITSILLHTRGRPGGLRNFYARRVLRIFPLYFGLLAVAAVVAAHSTRPDARGIGSFHHEQVWLWTYLVNFRMADVGHMLAFNAGPFLFPHFWSLCVEEHFYMAWPFVALLGPRRWLPAIAVAVVATAAVARAAFVLSRPVPDGPFVAYILTPFRLDGLLAGAVLAMAMERPGFRDRVARWSTPLLLAVAATLVLGYVACGWDNMRRPVALVGYPVLAATFVAVVACCVVLPPTHPFIRAASHPALTTFGRYSYGLYALHIAVIHAALAPAEAAADRLLHSTTAGHFVARVAMVPLALGVAMVSYHGYERHFLKLKRFFPTGHPGPVGGSTVGGPTVGGLTVGGLTVGGPTVGGPTVRG